MGWARAALRLRIARARREKPRFRATRLTPSLSQTREVVQLACNCRGITPRSDCVDEKYSSDARLLASE